MFGAVIIQKTVDIIIKPCLPEDHVFVVVDIVVLGSALQQKKKNKRLSFFLRQLFDSFQATNCCKKKTNLTNIAVKGGA